MVSVMSLIARYALRIVLSPPGVLLIAAAAVLLAWRRRRRMRGHGPYLPANAPKPAWPARVAEASAFAVTAVLMLWPDVTSGPMGRLGGMRPEFASVQEIAFAVTLGLALLAIATALRGWTLVGAIVLTGTLAGYGWVCNGHQNALWAMTPEGADRPIVQYAISLEHDIKGADLWVNDVYLGKTPVVMTLDEFHDKVKPWPEPPKDLSDRSQEVRIPHETLVSRGKSAAIYYTWLRLSGVPVLKKTARIGYEVDYDRGDALDKYYARVRLGDEWGYGYGGGWGGGARGSYTWNYEATLEVQFAGRQEKLAALLRKARLTDYRGDAALFSALETYGEEGWRAVRTAAQHEPRMMEFLDSWARWRYGLDKVTDSKTAWATLDALRKEADATGEFHSLAVEGRAVELLVPFLDQRQLVEESTNLIPLARVNARVRPSGEIAGVVSMAPAASGVVSLRLCNVSTESRNRPLPGVPASDEEKTSHFESGVQAKYGPGSSTYSVASDSPNTRSCPPRCGISIRAHLVGESFRRKAMNIPSGDQAGLKSSAGSVVNRDGGSTPICLI